MENVITRESPVFTEMSARFERMENELDKLLFGQYAVSGKWIDGEEIRKMLCISKRTLQNYRDSGILPYSTIGGKFYYSMKDIEKLIAKNYVSIYYGVS